MSTTKAPHVFPFRGSITRPLIWLSTLRSGGRPPSRKTRFWLPARLCQTGWVTRRVPTKGFRVRDSSSLPKLFLTQGHSDSSTVPFPVFLNLREKSECPLRHSSVGRGFLTSSDRRASHSRPSGDDRRATGSGGRDHAAGRRERRWTGSGSSEPTRHRERNSATPCNRGSVGLHPGRNCSRLRRGAASCRSVPREAGREA